MLCPPSRDRCVRNQEREVGQVAPAVISPPLRCEAKQNFDDIAEPHIGSGCCPFARRQWKRDFGQERGWHGKDRGVGFERGAVATAHGNPPACLLNRRYGGSEMEC